MATQNGSKLSVEEQRTLLELLGKFKEQTSAEQPQNSSSSGRATPKAAQTKTTEDQQQSSSGSVAGKGEGEDPSTGLAGVLGGGGSGKRQKPIGCKELCSSVSALLPEEFVAARYSMVSAIMKHYTGADVPSFVDICEQQQKYYSSASKSQEVAEKEEVEVEAEVEAETEQEKESSLGKRQAQEGEEQPTTEKTEPAQSAPQTKRVRTEQVQPRIQSAATQLPPGVTLEEIGSILDSL